MKTDIPVELFYRVPKYKWVARSEPAGVRFSFDPRSVPLRSEHPKTKLVSSHHVVFTFWRFYTIDKSRKILITTGSIYIYFGFILKCS